MTYRIGRRFLLVPLTICVASISAAYFTWQSSRSHTATVSALVGTMMCTAFIASFLMSVYLRRAKKLELVDIEVAESQQDDSAQKSYRGCLSNLAGTVFKMFGIWGALVFAIGLAGGVELFTQDWLEYHILKKVVVWAVFLLIGCFFIAEALCYRYMAGNIESDRWRQAFVFLYTCVMGSMGAVL